MMQKKIFVFMVCVFLIVTGNTIKADKECKVKNCESCESGDSCVCQKCKSNYILLPFGECLKKNTCDVLNCGVCKDYEPFKCLVCNNGYLFNNDTGSCEPIPECNVENCYFCYTNHPDTCYLCDWSYITNDDHNKCVKNYQFCDVDHCEICDFCYGSVCKKCKSGFHVLNDGTCAPGSSGDLAAYRVTYLLYFAILLMTAVIVAQKV